MQKQIQENCFSKINLNLFSKKLPAKVWRHDFIFKEEPEKGFSISFQKDSSFYLIAFLGFIFSIPVTCSIFTSTIALFSDPFEPFLLFFNLFLNTARFFFIKVMYDFIKDAYREIEFSDFDQMISIKTCCLIGLKTKNRIYHISEIKGIHLKVLKDNACQPSGSFSTHDSEPCSYGLNPNRYCEMALEMNDGHKVILMPKIDSITEARETVRRIQKHIKVPLLTKIGSLYH